MFRTTATCIALSAMLALPTAGLTTTTKTKPTAKQAFLVKLQPAATAYGAKRHWRISGKIITAVSTTTFLGKTQGYGSGVVSYTGKGIVAASAVWSATLTRTNGKWIVTKLTLGAVSRVS